MSHASIPQPGPPAPLTHSSALVRLTRAASTAGDVLAALILIVGGCGLVGFASLF